jgi:hypothetical protein
MNKTHFVVHPFMLCLASSVQDKFTRKFVKFINKFAGTHQLLGGCPSVGAYRLKMKLAEE